MFFGGSVHTEREAYHKEGEDGDETRQVLLLTKYTSKKANTKEMKERKYKPQASGNAHTTVKIF